MLCPRQAKWLDTQSTKPTVIRQPKVLKERECCVYTPKSHKFTWDITVTEKKAYHQMAQVCYKGLLCSTLNFQLVSDTASAKESLDTQGLWFNTSISVSNRDLFQPLLPEFIASGDAGNYLPRQVLHWAMAFPPSQGKRDGCFTPIFPGAHERSLDEAIFDMIQHKAGKCYLSSSHVCIPCLSKEGKTTIKRPLPKMANNIIKPIYSKSL